MLCEGSEIRSRPAESDRMFSNFGDTACYFFFCGSCKKLSIIKFLENANYERSGKQNSVDVGSNSESRKYVGAEHKSRCSTPIDNLGSDGYNRWKAPFVCSTSSMTRIR